MNQIAPANLVIAVHTWKREDGSLEITCGAVRERVLKQSGYSDWSTKILEPNVLDTSIRISSWPRRSHARYTKGACGCFQMQFITCSY